eukprot:gnl/TRDRNA2_/TRDRNA2_62165_c0_seq1.p1 gnl/TRDRNA2_/TRDRNA2_62165_c0~~gnl/TRDRNA2_/TRDRNA2_62165_c0_seq1.p1  ORF type:complete len:339 (+),score=81.97 gnl/TRDRNA2_/TRDRNA2_62165_c0_seq1:43-1059(+)
MAPKKPKAKPKAKEGYSKETPPAAVEQDDPEKEERKRIFMKRLQAKKWAQSQLESVQIQARAAEKEEIEWLAECHGFHEVSLIKIVRRLDTEKTLDDVPEEARAKIAAYCAQSANGPGKVDRDTFQPMADIWEWASTDAEKYQRPPVSAEDAAAEKRLSEWSDSSISGMADFIALMSAHASAPSVQQIGLIQIGALCPEEGKSDPSVDVSGMKSATLVPAIDSAMRAHDQDIQVLRGGYAALRALAMVPGEFPKLCDLGGTRVAAEMLEKHYKDAELAETANMAIFVMAKQSGKNSPELKAMLDAGLLKALQRVMTHHAWNHALVSKVRLTFPFLTEE